jgi:hypothetical protein
MPETESNMNIQNFEEKPTDSKKQPSCVDGRIDPTKPENEQGPQGLGASLQPIINAAVYHNQELNEEFIESSIKKLIDAGFHPGVHRGPAHDHHDLQNPASGCGYADNLSRVFETIAEKKNTITTIVSPFVSEESVRNAFDKLITYGRSGKIKLTRGALISATENAIRKYDPNYKSEMLQGKHSEEAIFINTKPNVTLNRISLNRQHRQAFNLDTEPMDEQAKVLGVPEDFSKAASLISYSSIGDILTVQKGKPKLPIFLHK